MSGSSNKGCPQEKKDWEQLLSKKGCKGGMLAETTTREEMLEEHTQIVLEMQIPVRVANYPAQTGEDIYPGLQSMQS
jgi:hypothetical protein